MKKVLVLLGSVLVAGCFVCHKTAPQQEKSASVELMVVQQSPAPAEDVVMRYTFPEAANFAFDSRELNLGMSRVDKVMIDIKAYPNAVVLVEGHTDNIGSEEYNKNLSADRARVVAKELVAKGCTNPIRIYGAGASMPIASNDTEEGRAQNRRVDVVIVRNEK